MFFIIVKKCEFDLEYADITQFCKRWSLKIGNFGVFSQT